MAPLPPPPPSWAILDRCPRFHEEGGIRVGARSAPATSYILLPYHRLDGSVPQGLPYILAADRTGGLLLSFTKLGGAQAQPELALLTVYKDSLAATLLTLPPRKPPVHPIASITAIGFMPTRSSRSGHLAYIVSELQVQPIPNSDTGRARLISINTEGGDWVEKEFLLPASHARRPWGRDGVLSHGGMLWWSDLSWGLVCCDPLAPAPNLVFVKLPDGSDLGFADHRAVEGRRIWTISGSRIRYLEISRVRDGPSRMTLSTLRATADAAVWNWEESDGAIFAHIWAGESYARTRLPARLPTLTVINPIDPDMVCFHLEGYLVGLHLASNRVGWVAHHDPAADYIAWEIPHYLISSGTEPASGAIVGALSFRGFGCRFIRCSPFSTCMLINRLFRPAVFSIRLWHKKYPINQLELVEQFGGSGSLLYSSNADAVGVSPVIVPSFQDFILFAPIPDLQFIFKMFRISADSRIEGHGMLEGFKPTGQTRLVGSFEDVNKRVIFREHIGTPNPILMLECSLGDIECFGIQIMTYLPFCNLTIKMSRDGISTVSLKVEEDSTELKTTTDEPVISYIPLPYLAKVATLFP